MVFHDMVLDGKVLKGSVLDGMVFDGKVLKGSELDYMVLYAMVSNQCCWMVCFCIVLFVLYSMVLDNL